MYTGPVSGWATLRSSFSRSLAVERGPICRSFASRVSSASASPGSTSTIGAMSGCQRLWPVCGSSRRRLPRSMATVFMSPAYPPDAHRLSTGSGKSSAPGVAPDLPHLFVGDDVHEPQEDVARQLLQPRPAREINFRCAQMQPQLLLA